MRWRLTMVVLTAACIGSGHRGGGEHASRPAGLPDCGTIVGATVTDFAVASVSIGQNADSLKRACSSVRDTIIEDGEAIARRHLFVAVAHDTLDVTVDSGRVANITVHSAELWTRDSLAVGDPIDRLLDAGAATATEGEDAVYVTISSHCGMSFLLDYAIPEAAHRRTWSAKDLRTLPSGVRVREINVFGCSKR